MYIQPVMETGVAGEGIEERVCVVGWGQTSQGQLGLGGIEETTITEPRYYLCSQFVEFLSETLHV